MGHSVLIYIDEKFPLFIPSKDEILVKKTPTSLQEKKTGCCQWTIILIFCVDVHMGLDHPPPPTCVHPSLATTPCGRHKWMAPNNISWRPPRPSKAPILKIWKIATSQTPRINAYAIRCCIVSGVGRGGEDSCPRAQAKGRKIGDQKSIFKAF